MPVDLEDFLTELMQDVSASAAAAGSLTRTILVENLAERLVASEEIQDWSPCHYEGRGKKRTLIGIDGYSTEDLDLDGTLQVLIAVARSGVTVEALSFTDLKAAFGRAVAFVSQARAGWLHEDLEPSTPAADFARFVHDSRDQIRTLRVYVLSNASLGPRVRQVERSDDESMRVELHVWDLARFEKLADTGGLEPIEIDVTTFVPGGLPALSAGIGSTDYGAYLCVVPGSFLAGVYGEYGSRILEGNVRSFLTAKGKVNKGLRTTILTQPDHFFAFNNGITATAAGVAIEPNGHIIKIMDLQIVNGGQTTASLFNARRNDDACLDRVFVQMKLSVLPPERALAMVPEIARYANTQNKVSEADLFANHPFNRRIEELSRRLWAPPRSGSSQMTHWFYERARAQFQTEQLHLTPARRKAFLLANPKAQVLTKTDVAKFENTWLCLPHVVSSGAQKNFLKFAERVGSLFHEDPDSFNDRWFKHLVAKAILFHATEKIVSAAKWYQNAYRANVVTYSIARLVRLVGEQTPGHVLDLDMIWKNQEVPAIAAEALERIGESVLRTLMSPPVEGANVTEWAKKEACWKEVNLGRVLGVPLLTGCIKSLEEEDEDKRAAQNDRRVVSSLSLQMQCVQRAEAGYWMKAWLWPRTKTVVTHKEFSVLSTASSRGSSWIPTELQAKHLMSAARKIDAEGFS